MRIIDWSSDVCSSDLIQPVEAFGPQPVGNRGVAKIAVGAGQRDGAAVGSGEGIGDRGADAAARAGDQDMRGHAAALAAALVKSKGSSKPSVCPSLSTGSTEERRERNRGVSNGKFRWGPD